MNTPKRCSISASSRLPEWDALKTITGGPSCASAPATSSSCRPPSHAWAGWPAHSTAAPASPSTLSSMHRRSHPLEKMRRSGCATIAVDCNPVSKLRPLGGSTRLEAAFRRGHVWPRVEGCPRDRMIELKRAALAALVTLGLATSALAQTPAATLQWPQAHSDLKADSSIRFGVLPNGMRYAIMKNATPPGQVSMRLRFDVGSLMERDDQQGLAHFLEHMAFNGSTNVPTRGDMVKDLERLGLAFGADTNAGTDFNATTYKFDLPKSDDQSVDTSLMLLREIAGNLTLDQGAMDQERGVILSEERLRDTPGYRITKQRFGFLMAGQRPPERFPIGLVPVIQNAKVDLIADIYRKYYRPERATLVIVGDVDPAAMEAKIKARFGDWEGKGPAG